MSVLLYPLATEKNIRMVEEENKIVFVVEKKASKSLIKNAFEKQFKSKVVKVNVLNDFNGRKKAIISLDKGVNALDIASELGMM